MAEYIDRQAAIKAVGYFSLRTDGGMRFADTALKALPPADVRPVVRGRWEPKMHPMVNGALTQDNDEWYGPVYVCDQCGFEMIGTENFCPGCGADMREGNP